MFAYLVRRLLWAAMLVIAVTVVTYVIFYAIPANPARLACGQRATPQCVQRAAHFLGTDRPVYVQYAKFLDRLVIHHSLGRSFTNRQSVNSTILNAAPVTASLVFGGMLIWLMVAIPIGILSALRPRSLLDRVTMTFVLIGISAHPVWIGLLATYFLGFKASLFPISGYCNFFNNSGGCGGPVQWAWHMLLPCLTLAVFFAAMYVRMVRANVIEALDEDWVRTARAKGASELWVVRGHVLRNALLPVVTMLGMDVGLAIGSAGFVEIVFGLPGVGRVAIENLGLVRTIETGNYAPLDLPIIAGAVVVITATIIVANLAADLLYSWLDPRIDPSGEAIKT